MSKNLLKRHSSLPEVLLGINSPIFDDRGTFRRLFDKKDIECALSEFGEGSFQTIQSNLSTNLKSGTWRGLHTQVSSSAETKVVTCIQGSVLDFFVDMRRNSPNYLKLGSCSLNALVGEYVVIPKGFAHGYLTLEDNSSIVYFVDTPYSIKDEIGFNIFDPAFNFPFKDKIVSISDKDKNWPFLSL